MYQCNICEEKFDNPINFSKQGVLKKCPICGSLTYTRTNEITSKNEIIEICMKYLKIIKTNFEKELGDKEETRIVISKELIKEIIDIIDTISTKAGCLDNVENIQKEKA